MALKLIVTSADKDGVHLDVSENDAQVKHLVKKYSSLLAFRSMLKKWYHKDLPSISEPGSRSFLHTNTVDDAQAAAQKFLDAVIAQFDANSFPVKSFFRLYNLQGKVAIVTGASGGIGAFTAQQLAEMGAHVICASRGAEKMTPIINQIKESSGNPNVEFMQLDLLHLDSVRSFVQNFRQRNLPLHLLVNNAANVGDVGLTDYGIDRTFGTNYLAVFLLTHGLIELLKVQPDSRIVFVSSLAAFLPKGHLPYDRLRTAIPFSTIIHPFEAYGYSKLALCTFSRTLATKFRQADYPIRTYSLHPGVVKTNFANHIPLNGFWQTMLGVIPAEEGSWTTLYCAVADESAHESGLFYNYEEGRLPSKKQPLQDTDADEELEKTLWQFSVDIAKPSFDEGGLVSSN